MPEQEELPHGMTLPAPEPGRKRTGGPGLCGMGFTPPYRSGCKGPFAKGLRWLDRW